MATFETRPARKEAYRFTRKRLLDPSPDAPCPGLSQGTHHDGGTFYFVVTAHGQQTTVEFGDWIVPEPDGRGHYPVKDDIFRSRHDPVCTCTVHPSVARCKHHPECALIH